MTVALQALSLVEKAEPVRDRFTWRSNGSCFMVTWTISKHRLLEVGLTQNRWETLALRTFATVDFYFFIFLKIMCEDPCEWRFIEIAFG